MGSKKALVHVKVLSGPTHFLTLPDQGEVQFIPGHTVKLYSLEDFLYVQRVLPGRQIKIRTFPRIEDAPVVSDGPWDADNPDNEETPEPEDDGDQGKPEKDKKDKKGKK